MVLPSDTSQQNQRKTVAPSYMQPIGGKFKKQTMEMVRGKPVRFLVSPMQGHLSKQSNNQASHGSVSNSNYIKSLA